MNKQLTIKIKIILYILLSAGSSTIFAQNTFDPAGAGDMSVQFIGQIFGGLVGGGMDAFGSSISTFNSIALIVGGILVGYGMLAGTLGTAHDGEMMGKKFSSVWVPIRTTVGTGLVLPVIKGGYCTIQAIVMWLVMQGISFANSVWVSYASSSAMTSAFNPKVGNASSAAISDYVNNLYLIQVCIAAGNKAADDVKKTSVNTDAAYSIMKAYNSTPESQKFKAGDNKGYFQFLKQSCGSIKYPVKPKETNKTAGGSDTAASIDSIKSLAKRQIKVDLAPIYEAQLTQAAKVVQDTAPLAEAAIVSSDDGAAAKAGIAKIIKSYTDAINAATNSSIATANQTLVDSAKNEGWFTAGTFATKIILVQGQLASAQEATGSAIFSAEYARFSNKYPESSKLINYAQNGMAWTGRLIVHEMATEMKNVIKTAASIMSGRWYWDSKYRQELREKADKADFFGEVTPRLIKYFTEVDLARLRSDTRHPILIAQDMGSSILKMAWGITIVTTTIGTVGGAIPFAGTAFVGAIIGFVGTAAAPLAGMWAIGGFLAYALPNLPLLIWFGVIMGWVLMVIQAVLAAPLWAIMHVHPSGDDMIGKGNEGYMLVLGLTIRPPLIIFGLIAAIVLSNIFGQFLNAIFMNSVTTPSSLYDAFNLTFIIVIYTALLTGVIQSTFSLVHKVPDQLLKWIGGGQEQLGGFSQMLEQGTFEKVNAAGGMATREIAQVGSGAAALLPGYLAGNKKSNQEDQRKANRELSKLNSNEQYIQEKSYTDRTGIAAEIFNHAQNNSPEGEFDPKSMKIQDQLNKANRIVNSLDKVDDTGKSIEIFRDKFNSSVGTLGVEGALKFATDSALRETSQFKQLSEDSISKLSENGDINSYLNNLGKVENLKNIAGNTIPQDKVMEILNNSLNSNENIADAFKNAESEIDSLVVKAQQTNIDDKNSQTVIDIGIGGEEETPR